MTPFAYFRVTLAGAVGGAINAWLCYAELPIPVDHAFRWHVVPAGAVHGALLAVGSLAGAMLLVNRNIGARVLGGVPVAWCVGFASWIPLNRSAFDDPWAESAAWPFRDEWADALWGPFMYFGLVALLYYLWLVFSCKRQRATATHIIAAIAAASLGSLWFWISFERWYFSLLHGAIWGVFVGVASAGALKGEGNQVARVA